MRGVWVGHAPAEKYEIKQLGNAISSILSIKKSVVCDDFFDQMSTVFEGANFLDSLLICF